LLFNYLAGIFVTNFLFPLLKRQVLTPIFFLMLLEIAMLLTRGVGSITNIIVGLLTAVDNIHQLFFQFSIVIHQNLLQGKIMKKSKSFTKARR
jgi:hypothetical protein